MRAAVYNEHWPTMGGGEKLAASFAEALRDIADVELLAHAPVDVVALGSHLDVDIAGVRVRQLERSREAVTAASAEYDLFINCSFLGAIHAAARKNVFVVMFPDRPPGITSDVTATLARHLKEHALQPPRTVRHIRGIHPEEHDGLRSYWWTDGDAALEVEIPDPAQGAHLYVRISGAHRPDSVGSGADVWIDGVRHHVELDRQRGTTVAVRIEPRAHPTVPVRIVSDAFSGPSSDARTFGVQVLDVDIRPRLREALAEPVLRHNHVEGAMSWLHSYDRVISISEYTQHWVREIWKSESDVIYPAVKPRRATTKRRLIVSVGRFFFEPGGHTKKQLELVEAFKQLRERGDAPGWELWLLGGVGNASYVETVRAAAEGLPVRVISSATPEQVNEAFGAATIYWHGMGLGENPHVEPILFEHFGISIVEAMSAGAVPVVPMDGGQAEIVRDGVTGFLAGAIDDVVEQTAALIRDDATRTALARAAMARSADFTFEVFRKSVHDLVSSL